MTPAQWIQLALTAGAILVAAVVVREAVKTLRRDVDNLAPKVDAVEKAEIARAQAQVEQLADINLKLGKLEGVPAGLIEVGQKVESVDRKLASTRLQVDSMRSLEKRVLRVEDQQQEIRLRLAERGVRTATPARGVPTLPPPGKNRNDDDDDGGS